MMQTYQDVEFIVHDDASTDHTAEVVKEFTAADSRFRYVNLGINAGMRSNFENALNSAQGDYILCLGGDDALIPGALEQLSELIKDFPEQVITWPTACYIYSTARATKSQFFGPHCIFQRPFTKRLDALGYIERQARQLSYITDHTAPMLYVKSCVPVSILRKAIDISGGRFFVSSTPDGYSSFALASIMDDYLYTNVCFTIHGASPSAAGLNYVIGKGGQDDHSDKFFKDSNSIPMAGQLALAPYSPLITLMTADFIFQTDNIFKHGQSTIISIELLIRKSLAALADGLFVASKIKRELDIICEVAKFYDKFAFFEAEIAKVRRNSRELLTGDTISAAQIYLDGDSRGLNNVSDAACFVKKYRNSSRIYTKFNPLGAAFNAVSYRRRNYQLKEPLADYF
jgi:glycosyltransferase involved in cell wall biosynthesis